MITVEVKNDGKVLAEIVIRKISSNLQDLPLADYVAIAYVYRGAGTFSSHRRFVSGFFRKQWNVFALLREIFLMLNEDDLKLEEGATLEETEVRRFKEIQGF